MQPLTCMMTPPLSPTPCSPCLRVAGNKEEGNGKGGKSNGKGNKEGDGEEEGNGKGGKSNGIGDKDGWQ